MDANLTKFNAALLEIETQVDASRSLKKTARAEEIRALEERLASLENEIGQFQMKNPYHFQDEINELESKAMEIRAAMDSTMNAASKVPEASQVPQAPQHKANEGRLVMDQALVQRANEGLAEAKAIALNLVKTAEKMREEVNLIDDEVMLQKEKLVRINRQIKETQDITLQTQKLVRFVTLTVNQDKFIKMMIGLVTLILVTVLVMAVCIRFRQNKMEDKKKVIQVRKLDFTEREVNPGGFAKVRTNQYAIEWLEVELEERDFYPWKQNGLIESKNEPVIELQLHGESPPDSIIDIQALKAMQKVKESAAHPGLSTSISDLIWELIGPPIGLFLDAGVRDPLPSEFEPSEKPVRSFTDPVETVKSTIKPKSLRRNRKISLDFGNIPKEANPSVSQQKALLSSEKDLKKQ